MNKVIITCCIIIMASIVGCATVPSHCNFTGRPAAQVQPVEVGQSIDNVDPLPAPRKVSVPGDAPRSIAQIVTGKPLGVLGLPDRLPRFSDRRQVTFRTANTGTQW